MPRRGSAGILVQVRRASDLPERLDELVAGWRRAGRTSFVVVRDGMPVGMIGVADEVRPDAAETVRRFRHLGLDVAMVTGDHATTARAIAERAGIDRVMADVPPEGKVDEVRRLRSGGRRVAFVGDGINDAPALAAASVGIAMGGGTDVALAAADVNVLGGSLGAVADALGLARRTYRIIRQNLVWAFGYNVIMIPLAVVGVLDPMLAASAMALSSVSVVLNALRLRGFGKDRARAGVGTVATAAA